MATSSQNKTQSGVNLSFYQVLVYSQDDSCKITHDILYLNDREYLNVLRLFPLLDKKYNIDIRPTEI